VLPSERSPHRRPDSQGCDRPRVCQSLSAPREVSARPGVDQTFQHPGKPPESPTATRPCPTEQIDGSRTEPLGFPGWGVQADERNQRWPALTLAE